MLKKLRKLIWILIKEFLKTIVYFSIMLLVIIIITHGIFYFVELIIYIFNLSGYDVAYSDRNIKTILFIPIFIACLFVIVYMPLRAAACFIVKEYKKL